MKLKFLGVRGSRPTHHLNLLGYGGNTTSMEFLFENEDFQVFLDGGSGLAHYGRGKSDPSGTDKKRVYFLITHTHWDHILGFPYFKMFLNPKTKFTFFSSITSKATFSELFLGMHRAKHLQVPPFLSRAHLNFESVAADQEFSIENCVKVRTHQINHQGITLAYRLEYKGSSVAIVTDNAPIENNYLGEGMVEKAAGREREFEREYNESLVNFLKGVHTVVFDTHFTEQNLKADWGHSTVPRALDFCIAAGVKRLGVFHHAPEDSDQDVTNKVNDVVEKARKHGVDVVATQEGDVWTLCE